MPVRRHADPATWVRKQPGRAGSGRQPGKFSIAGEGLNIGKDAGEPVTDD